MPASKKDEKLITSILEKVDRKENALDKRFHWMDHDYENGWRLDPYTPKAGDGISQEDAYTSNYPKVLNTRVSGAIAGAEQIIRVSSGHSRRSGPESGKLGGAEYRDGFFANSELRDSG